MAVRSDPTTSNEVAGVHAQSPRASAPAAGARALTHVHKNTQFRRGLAVMEKTWGDPHVRQQEWHCRSHKAAA